MPAKPHGYWIAAFISLTALCTNAFGQIPAEKLHNGIAYVSGGIGDDEEIHIRRAAKDYGVLLEFAEVERGTSHGRWTADVNLRVKAGAQTVFSARGRAADADQTQAGQLCGRGRAPGRQAGQAA